MLAQLPVELIENILRFANPYDILNVSSVNRKLNYIDNSDTIWKHKFLNSNYKGKKPKNSSYKLTYLKCYSRFCYNCGKKTTVFNKFYDMKICLNCKRDCEEYKVISYTRAIKEYYLSVRELSELQSVIEINPFNKSKTMTVYLKKDIVKASKKKYGYYNYPENLQQRSMTIARNKSIFKLVKLFTLMNYLRDNYSIDYDDEVYMYINGYSQKLFSKYINNVYSNIHSGLLRNFIELKFILEFSTIHYTLWSHSFEEKLLYALLTNNIKTYNISGFILNQINYLVKHNDDKFQRKRKILEKFPTINLEDQFICDFIYNGGILFKEFHEKLLLYTFSSGLYTPLIIFRQFDNPNDDLDLFYIRVLNYNYIKFPEQRHLIPKEITSFIYY